MLAKLQRDYRHSLPNIPLSFEQSDSGLQRYGAAVKTCITKFGALIYDLIIPQLR
jgi:hypothetical protein